MKFTFFSLLLISFVTVHGQDNFVFETPTSTGTVPTNFIGVSRDKYEREVSKKEHSKLEDQFALEAQYSLSSILQSGKVIFNDEVTNYLNKVMDKLFAGNHSLRNKLEVYTIKSTMVNAFCTKSGVIIVSTGLLAQLENEAQLAFVLAHESVHFTEEHGIESYEHRHESSRGKGQYRRLDSEERVLRRHLYSRENELEADKKGLALLEDSEYSMSTILNVFDILKYSYLHFDEVPFERDFFNDENFIIPDEFFLDVVSEIKLDDDFDEDKSTHPSASSRKEQLDSRIVNSVNEGKKQYLVSEDRFKDIQKICRYENTRQYLLSSRYKKALYNSFLLLKTYGRTNYIDESIGYALYGLAKKKIYANEITRQISSVFDYEDEDFDDDDYYSDIEGEYQQIVYLFGKLSMDHLISLAVKYNNQNYTRFQSQFSYAMLRDLFEDMNAYNTVSMHDYSRKPLKQKEVIEDSTKAKTKLEKIREQSVDYTSDGAFFRYALVGVSNFNELLDLFDELEEDVTSNKEDFDDYYDSFNSFDRIAGNPDNKKKLRHDGYTLGIDKLAVLSPIVRITDERKRNEVRLQNAEQLNLNLNSKINAISRMVGLQASLLDLHSTNVSLTTFNQHNLLREYYYEKLGHLSIELISPIYYEVEKLRSSLGTNYACLLGNMELIERRKNIGSVLFYSIVYFPLLPYGIWYAATPMRHTAYFSIIMNLAEDKLEFIEYKELKSKNYPELKNQNLYTTFYQAHQGGEEK